MKNNVKLRALHIMKARTTKGIRRAFYKLMVHSQNEILLEKERLLSVKLTKKLKDIN